MRQSELFTKTLRENPKDETSANAQLLERAGFIYKNSAGVYSFLPLGLRVLKKIENIIREEMDAIGGQELLMAGLHDKKYLTASGRWDVDVVFKVISGDNPEPAYNMSWTHEELFAEIATKYINSYKDLPFSGYQFQTKYRDEPRPKSGLLRGREFIMKDLYSFHTDEKDLYKFYNIVKGAYLKIFERCGLKSYYTLAPGGDFTVSNTHEFQVLAPVGEDTIFLCSKCEYAENKVISKLKSAKCPTRLSDGQECGGKLKEEKAIEVGNIFPLGEKYSKAFNLKYVDEKGNKKFVVMGSYGIGLGRTMATIVEIFHDKKGIIWPETVAPFKVHLIELKGASAEKIYKDLIKQGVEVLYDDRDVSAGEKFANTDLIGIPYRVVVSEKTIKQGKVELKKRGEDKMKLIYAGKILQTICK